MSSGVIYSFGPFAIDAVARVLTREGTPVSLSDRHLEVLLRLVANRGAVQSKDALVEAAWRDVAVTDNSLEQAISILRRILAADAGGAQHIQTIPRQGYRFVGEVTRSAAGESAAALAALLSPHRVWLEGRAALETLERTEVLAAEQAFRRVLEIAPDHPLAHLGLANACVLRFESTRADEQPDVAALREALAHAGDACRLDSAAGEPWATLGFILHRTGDVERAIAAARRAIALEPDNWRHHLRLGFVSWGEERRQSAVRTLQRLPGLALAHWLAATVYVARQAFEAADRELDAGAAAQDEEAAGASRFSAVGLHWLRGLVRLRRGDRSGALESLHRELAFESRGHLYARESAANAWYAIAADAHRERRFPDARRALDEALSRAPGHMPARAARTALAAEPGAGSFPGPGRDIMPSAVSSHHGVAFDAAFAEAVAIAVAGDAAHATRAAETVRQALTAAPAGSRGWMIPVEPFFRVSEHGREWAAVLATLRRLAA